MPNYCKAKIVATVGPASSTPERLRALFEAGADVFRLNFSHGSHEDHRARYQMLREIEAETGRPVGIMLDLQGPKLRVGKFEHGPIGLAQGEAFRFDLNLERAGNPRRVPLPHPEIFAALHPGTDLLIDDGKLRLRVEQCGPDFAETRVITGGQLSDRKGVNVPGVLLPMSAMTDKDRADLAFGLELGVDWVALSFVQRPQDIIDIKQLVEGRAGVVAKLEKPAAIQKLHEIIALTDAVMVARGDLGVEMPAEQVPRIQKEIVRACRKVGKPVIVATQMLDSMVVAPLPTRAEASDVATAIYDGVDAVMLSAESASGNYPVEAVRMMDNIIKQTESDPFYREAMEASHTPAQPSIADAIGSALHAVTGLLKVAVCVSYTSSGYSALRMARERPPAPILTLTPNIATARRLALVWGVHAVHTHEIEHVDEMADKACATAVREGLAQPGDIIAITAGMPFGVSGTTNILRISQVK
ncbi:MAG: pyruvate kinase [Rhodocyclaceae bacterium]|nr:pyruvate kinase [Rhodocyclaceae bacterium]MBX3668048.1 pyruvate kinase [Rhodocyclaceae bacterium]